MSERCRIVLSRGMSYMVERPASEVAEQALGAPDDDVLQFPTMNGQEAFPPETLYIRAREIISVQTVSEEAWIWQKQADSLHYARLLQDQTPAEQLAETQDRLVEVLKQGDVE